MNRYETAGWYNCSILIAFLSGLTAFPVSAQRLAGEIRLNQTGFYPQAAKIAVVVEAEAPGRAVGATRAGQTTRAGSTISAGEADRFYITGPDLRDTVYTGLLDTSRSSANSAGSTRIADFSSLKKEGIFVLCIPGLGKSYPFEIRGEVHREIAKASLKGFYFQRTATTLLPEHAGKWARAGGHPDTAVLIHGAAASSQRPEGLVISAPGGWYDAGDYNKYMVNSGITVGTLLSLYEDFPEYFIKQNLDIPESANSIPDLLDEVLWNLRWMLSMQDPHDGGVYHKLTAADFEGMVMPETAVSKRYVVQKSTAASLDFSAVMAQAARIFSDMEQELHGLSDSCLNAAVKAWEWALENPDSIYNQEEMNRKYDPDVHTGAYGDHYPEDEFIWAAAELFISTGEEKYYTIIEMFPDDELPLPSWSQVRLLGYYSLLRWEKKLSPVVKKDITKLKNRLTRLAGKWIAQAAAQPYGTVMGCSADDFAWGSNAVAANQGILLIQAYRADPDKKYLEYALANLDYLLGRNATGYSFLTGFGDKTPMHPHHRPSVADGVPEPVPGLLAGGPNAGMQDGCDYPSTLPGQAYIDSDCSYASNEIAINWNAPFVYLVSALEAILPLEEGKSF